MSDTISHSGIVDTVSDGLVRVRILQSSACHGCKVASHCSSAESKEKVIDVHTDQWQEYTHGQSVNVLAANAVGRRAVIIAFVVPSVLLLLGTAAVVLMGGGEALAALVGLAVVAVYYVGVWLMGARLTASLTFSLQPL